MIILMISVKLPLWLSDRQTTKSGEFHLSDIALEDEYDMIWFGK